MAQTCPDNLYITDLPPNFDDDQLKSVFGAYGVILQCRALQAKQPGGPVAALVRMQSPDEAQWIVDNLNGNIPQGLSGPIKVRLADTPEARQQKGGGKGGYGKADTGKGGGAWPSPYSKGGGGYDGGKSGGKGAFGKAGGMSGGGCKGGWGKDGGKDSGKGGKGGKGKGKCSIHDVVKGMVKGGALPGTQEYSNDENAIYIAGLPNDTTDLELYKIFGTFGSIPPRGVRAMLGDDGMCKGFGFVNYIDPANAQVAIMTLNGALLPNGSALTVKMKGPSKAAGAGPAGAAIADGQFDGMGQEWDAQMQDLLTQQ